MAFHLDIYYGNPSDDDDEDRLDAEVADAMYERYLADPTGAVRLTDFSDNFADEDWDASADERADADSWDDSHWDAVEALDPPDYSRYLY